MYNIANNMDQDQTAPTPWEQSDQSCHNMTTLIEFQYYCLLPQKVCLNN